VERARQREESRGPERADGSCRNAAESAGRTHRAARRPVTSKRAACGPGPRGGREEVSSRRCRTWREDRSPKRVDVDLEAARSRRAWPGTPSARKVTSRRRGRTINLQPLRLAPSSLGRAGEPVVQPAELTSRPRLPGRRGGGNDHVAARGHSALSPAARPTWTPGARSKSLRVSSSARDPSIWACIAGGARVGAKILPRTAWTVTSKRRAAGGESVPPGERGRWRPRSALAVG
jgi:hypothetical protein